MKKSFERNNVTKSCSTLVKEFHEKGVLNNGELLSFDIEKNHHLEKNQILDVIDSTSGKITIYNPTRPIYRNGKKYILGRVEPEESEESKIMFFEETEGGIWRIVDEAPVLGLQDPFYIDNIHGNHIIGGVKTFKENGKLFYETVFYKYKASILELFDRNNNVVEPFAAGPKGMKDIRLIELKSGKIAVFTRPQGGGAGLGKIGYIEIDSLDDLSHKISMARIIEGQFLEDEWGGANELHLLKNGMIGVLGHIAHFDGDIRHYYAMSFVYHPSKHRASHIEILTTADDFPPVTSKKSELGKIIFSGGMIRNNDGTADLYVGIGDVCAGKIKISDPFLKYEK